MAERYVQTVSLMVMALFLLVINQFYTLNWVWMTFSIFVFAGGTSITLQLIKGLQFKENIELLGIGLASVLIGATNVIGTQYSIISELNLLGVFIAVAIAVLQFFTLLSRYHTEVKPLKVKSLRESQMNLTKTILGSELHGN